MDALDALHSRISVNLLEEPGPNTAQIDNIVRAGLRACDHKNLRPWRYLLIEGEARNKLGNLLSNAKETLDNAPLDPITRDKIEKKPLRAPTIIAVVAHITENPSVPKIEQLLSAGASAQMMMTAAFAQGIGAIWRSGALMFERGLHRELGLTENQELVGFLYLGTPKVSKPVPELSPNDFLSRWNG
ncbi:nitroreductase [Arenicella chitinivorans]|uniref:Putative NAD(P)H nitroreductase n=1 Tax=Arenicella chitinivorans TaxID=1329800 RepID=A0A918RIV1_9GAMM|nr:nitroreductase family protein [Arenicella chitinivorans]GGZ99556.1 nitroreductase [Arenicella chitinivorans]